MRISHRGYASIIVGVLYWSQLRYGDAFYVEKLLPLGTCTRTDVVVFSFVVPCQLGSGSVHCKLNLGEKTKKIVLFFCSPHTRPLQNISCDIKRTSVGATS
jgi:hypothetical protein